MVVAQTEPTLQIRNYAKNLTGVQKIYYYKETNHSMKNMKSLMSAYDYWPALFAW